MLISGKESGAVLVAIAIDRSKELQEEEAFQGIVELVFPEMTSNIFHEVMRPVSVLNTVKKTIVLGHPKAVLKGVKVDSWVQRVS